MANPISSANRREMLVGLAAAPIATIPAIVGGKGLHDPVFVAIREHESKKAAATAAKEALTAAMDRFDAALDAIGWPTFRGEKIHNLERLDYLLGQKPVVSEERIEELIAQIREGHAKLQADANNPDPEYVAARAALEDRVGVYVQVATESGFAEADEAHEAAVAGEVEAEEAVLATEPTTPAGALELLRFIANQLGPVGIQREFMTAAARQIIAEKLSSVLSARMAMRLNSFSLQK